jgi:GDP-4-dehydro-6-deoxy-D-mannose reductase
MADGVLVTGAGGFVGGHLLELLRAGGARLVGWRRPGEMPHPFLADIEWRDVELLDGAAIDRALGEAAPTAIFHLAGAAHVGQSWNTIRQTYEGNVLATHRLFESLRRLRLSPRILVAGSATIYRPQDRPLVEDDPLAPTSPYAASKLAQEMLARAQWADTGLPSLIVRSFNHVGPRQAPDYVAPSIARQVALIEAGQAEPVLTVGNLEARRDLTDVRDTVRAYVALMERGEPGLPYNVCSGRPLAIGELLDVFLSRARVPVRIVQDPRRFRPNDPPLLVGDHSRLTRATGWAPRIPVGQTVDDLLKYWRERVPTNA